MTGWPRSLERLGRAWRCTRTGHCGPDGSRPLGLAVGLQAVAQLLEQPRHRPMADRVPLVDSSSSASVRVLLQVQRSGDFGSPRVAGSTSASSAGRKPASVSVSRGRPAPSRRTRCFAATGTRCLASPNCFIPAVIVGRVRPTARATTLTPPYPSARASVAAHSRRICSSITPRSASNFSAIRNSSSSTPQFYRIRYYL